MEKFTLTIDNFDNAAMVEDPTGEVARMLRETADKVERGDYEGGKLMDCNGNAVGNVSIED